MIAGALATLASTAGGIVDQGDGPPRPVPSTSDQRALPSPSSSPRPSPLPTASPTPTPSRTPAAAAYYADCTALREAGVTPLREDEPGYRPSLDSDNDGMACTINDFGGPDPEPESEPETEAEPVEDPVRQDVWPGAFCTPSGARGVTKTGKPMVCTTTATDSRRRWRAV